MVAETSNAYLKLYPKIMFTYICKHNIYIYMSHIINIYVTHNKTALYYLPTDYFSAIQSVSKSEFICLNVYHVFPHVSFIYHSYSFYRDCRLEVLRISMITFQRHGLQALEKDITGLYNWQEVGRLFASQREQRNTLHLQVFWSKWYKKKEFRGSRIRKKPV